MATIAAKAIKKAIADGKGVEGTYSVHWRPGKRGPQRFASVTIDGKDYDVSQTSWNKLSAHTNAERIGFKEHGHWAITKYKFN